MAGRIYVLTARCENHPIVSELYRDCLTWTGVLALADAREQYLPPSLSFPPENV